MRNRLVSSTGAVLAVSVSIAACGGSGQQTGHTATRSASVRRPAPKTDCLRAHGNYGGLGVSVSAFRATNNTGQPNNPEPGDVAFTILKTAKGCVTAFRVDIWTQPNPTAQQADQSISPQLRDALSPIISKPLPSSGVGGLWCEVWASRLLERQTGDRYAIATGEYAGIGDNAIAEITIWKTPACNIPISAYGKSDWNGL